MYNIYEKSQHSNTLNLTNKLVWNNRGVSKRIKKLTGNANTYGPLHTGLSTFPSSNIIKRAASKLKLDLK